MKEVEVTIDLAGDGSGYSLSVDNSPRTAYVWKEASETYSGMSRHLILPLSEDEEEVFFHKNIIECDGIRGLKLTNVWDSYINE